MSDLRRATVFAMLLALGVALWVLESLFPPPLPIPGAKLGLSNIVVLFTMSFLGYSEGIWLAVLRSLLGSLIGGTFLSIGFAMSLGGAVVSALAMALGLLWFRKILSLIGVSIIGAVVHNAAQLLLAYLLFIRRPEILYYLPFLLLAGLVTGAATGSILVYVDRRLALTGGAPFDNIEWD